MVHATTEQKIAYYLSKGELKLTKSGNPDKRTKLYKDCTNDWVNVVEYSSLRRCIPLPPSST